MPYSKPEGVGFARTDSSIAGAKVAIPKVAMLRVKVRNCLASSGRPLSSEQIAYAINEDYRSVQPRVSELRKDGIIVDSGTRVLSSRGVPIIAWTLA